MTVFVRSPRTKCCIFSRAIPWASSWSWGAQGTPTRIPEWHPLSMVTAQHTVATAKRMRPNRIEPVLPGLTPLTPRAPKQQQLVAHPFQSPPPSRGRFHPCAFAHVPFHEMDSNARMGVILPMPYCVETDSRFPDCSWFVPFQRVICCCWRDVPPHATTGSLKNDECPTRLFLVPSLLRDTDSIVGISAHTDACPNFLASWLRARGATRAKR